MTTALLMWTTALPHALAGGTAVWLAGEPQGSAVPGMALLDAASAAPMAPWTEQDSKAIAALRDEFTAVRPLIDVFDGELQIMRRLDVAVADVRTIREEDRDLLYRALLFQGYAAHRYFQATLATDPAAEPYRVVMNGAAAVRAWADAVALDPDRQPTESELPDETARRAFIEARAQLMLAPAAVIRATGLPPGGVLYVDGVAATTDTARVQPGYHRVTVTSGGVDVARIGLRLEADQAIKLPVPATEAELRSLGTELLGRPASLTLTPTVQHTLGELETPVVLAVTERKQHLIFDVAAGTARLRVEGSADPEDDRGFLVRAGLSAAWVYDGDFYLQNIDDGAPHDTATVNAIAPQLGVGGELHLGTLALGAGIDLSAPVGDHHALPVGESTVRLRPFPHLAFGLPVAQVTVGAWLPWRLGVGAKLHVPLWGPMELSGSYLYGIGLPIPRGDGLEDFEPARAQTAGIGVDVKLGG